MKQLITRTLTVLILMVAGVAVTASAQSGTIIKANIPFDFNFAGKSFPAGEYSLVQPEQHVLALRDAQRRMVAQTLVGGVESINPPDTTKLKFYVADGQYYLSEIWQQADSAGALVYPTKAQTEVARRRSAEARETAGGSQP